MSGDSGEEEPKKRPSLPPVEFLRPGEEQAPLQAQRFATGTPEEGEEEVTFDVLT